MTDSDWNLLAFGFDGKDYNAGPQDTWTSDSTPTEITADSRPPFNSPVTTCYLSQFANSIYVLNGDSSSPSTIHIYNVPSKAWTSHPVALGDYQASSPNTVAILDRDTDVFYSLSAGTMYAVNMTAVTEAPNGEPSPGEDKEWKLVGKSPYEGYDRPTMGLAMNHIHFIGVPGVQNGDADVFVIHYSYFQPETQKFGDFPNEHGQTASMFLSTGPVQNEFAYIPDDGSNTYIINVVSNTTRTLPAPTTKDANATYFGSPTALIQLASDGAVSFMPYDGENTSGSGGASWEGVKVLPAVKDVSNGGSDSGSSGNGNGGSGSGNGNGNGGDSNAQGTGGQEGGALAMSAGVGVVVGLVGLVVGAML